MDDVGISACEWLRRLDARELSARELASLFLARIEKVNPRLNALVDLEPDLTLADADHADAARAAGNPGALCGLPLTIKDCIDVDGFGSTGGSFARRDHRPAADASVVRRLRQAGAVVLGKSNAAEYLASYETSNVIHGRTNHPLDLERTPGGSSGGEAAIIAAGGSPAGIGTDGGGSIRVPAHYCGLAGLRPSTGRVPETGCWPGTRSTGLLDIHTFGPLARHVEDLYALLAVINGPDGVDPFAVPLPLEDWRTVDVGKLRVGYYTDDGLTKVTPETRHAVEGAALLLESRGCAVEEARPPAVVREATELFFSLVGSDGGERMRADLAPAGGRHHPDLLMLLNGLPDARPPADLYFALLRRAHDYRRELRAFVARYDVILSPVTTGPAPRHGEPPGDVPQDRYYAFEAYNYTHLVSLAAVPAVSVPVGTSDRLPLGVQVVADPFADHVAIAAAAVLESDCAPLQARHTGSLSDSLS
jgi:Asp-tRNA(Asn)/Glu-tRNA(Gln) amidotransferase A subunit family amidase